MRGVRKELSLGLSFNQAVNQKARTAWSTVRKQEILSQQQLSSDPGPYSVKSAETCKPDLACGCFKAIKEETVGFESALESGGVSCHL
jgi:hypothetical protein